MKITWFGIDGATYDVDKSPDNGVTWDSLEVDYASTELVDKDGDLRTLYRVRTHGNPLWNPPFYGTANVSPSRCSVYGYLRQADGSPAAGIDIFAFIPRAKQYLLDAFYTSDEPYGTVTNEMGYWSVDLPVGLIVQIRIPFAHVFETVTVPDMTSVALSSLL